MAKNVKINGVSYDDVPQVSIPLATGEGVADFYDTSDATASASEVLAGKTVYGATGRVSGIMTNNGAVSGAITSAGAAYTIPAGYHDGTGTVAIDGAESAKLVAGNIRAGVTVLGVSGSTTVVDTADATAAAGAILNGATAYVNGSKITGTLKAVSVSQDITSKVLTIS